MQQYLQVFLNSVQKKSRKPGKCFAVAFTSYEPEEGVSYVAQSFGVEIAKTNWKTHVDSRRAPAVAAQHYAVRPRRPQLFSDRCAESYGACRLKTTAPKRFDEIAESDIRIYNTFGGLIRYD
jgi:hypothetical protein